MESATPFISASVLSTKAFVKHKDLAMNLGLVLRTLCLVQYTVSAISLKDKLSNFSWGQLSNLQWIGRPKDYPDGSGKSILLSTDEIIDRAEKKLLVIHDLNPDVHVAKDVFTMCNKIDSLRVQLVKELEAPQWKPFEPQIRQFFYIKTKSFREKLSMHTADDLPSQASRLLDALRHFTREMQETTALLQSSELYSQEFSTARKDEEFSFANTLDELTVGRLVGEGISEKIREMIIGGDVHTAITEIANIFCDFGTLMTAYITGMAICYLGIGAGLCGISIIICGGGTVIFVCRVLQTLHKAFKTLEFEL